MFSRLTRQFILMAIIGTSLFCTEAFGQVFRRVNGRVISLDPIEEATVYAARSVSLVYETLLEYDYTTRPYKLKPSLAQSMPSVDEAGLVYEFTINTNIYFTPNRCFGLNEDGSPKTRHIVASDLVYSFKRLADAKLPSSGYWILRGRVKGIDDFHALSKTNQVTDYGIAVEGLSAPTDDRLVITLSTPSPVFEWLLALPYASVVAHEAVEFYGSVFRENPVGTGPYKLADWRRNYALRFSRNHAWRGWNTSGLAEDAKRGLYPFEEIFYPEIEDPSTQWLAFLSGDLDIQGEVSRDNWDEVVTTNGTLNPSLAKKGFEMVTMPTLEVSYIGINMDDPLLGKNKYLRQALNAAFDSARWTDFYRGRIVPASGAVPPGVAGADSSPLPFGRGLEVARNLLAKAGYPEGIDPATGRRLRLVIDLGRTTQDMRESTELLIAFFDRCGIELVAEYHSWPSFLEKVSKRRSQLFRIGWVGDYPDAENFLQLFYGPSASPGPNRCNYNNPEFDKLFREAMASNQARRLELYGEMQKIIKEDCPWIFLGYSTALSLVAPTVEGYIPHDFPYGMEKHFRCKKTLR